MTTTITIYSDSNGKISTVRVSDSDATSDFVMQPTDTLSVTTHDGVQVSFVKLATADVAPVAEAEPVAAPAVATADAAPIVDVGGDGPGPKT